MTVALRREAYRWVATVLEDGVGEYRALFEGRPELLEEVRRIGDAMEAAGVIDDSLAEAPPVAAVAAKTTNGTELDRDGVLEALGQGSPF